MGIRKHNKSLTKHWKEPHRTTITYCFNTFAIIHCLVLVGFMVFLSMLVCTFVAGGQLSFLLKRLDKKTGNIWSLRTVEGYYDVRFIAQASVFLWFITITASMISVSATVTSTSAMSMFVLSPSLLCWSYYVQ